MCTIGNYTANNTWDPEAVILDILQNSCYRVCTIGNCTANNTWDPEAVVLESLQDSVIG